MKPILFDTGWSYYKDIGRRMGPRGGGPEMPPITLPHDATIHEFRTPDAPGGLTKGYFPDGDYTYSKTFFAPAEWETQKVSLIFEAAYMNAIVFINGDYAGQRVNGYAEFVIECNNFLKFGEENTVVVKVISDRDSRWYSGAGLYRHVWLRVADPLHIVQDGVRLTTQSCDAEVAAVEAEITLVNQGITARDVVVTVDIIDDEGQVACHDFQKLHIYADETEVLYPRLYVKNPKLWDLDNPNLYSVVVKIMDGETVVDEAEIETFGIRVLTLDNVHGLTINGKTVKLYGGCIHHDNGLIGAVSIEAAEIRRMKTVKAAGYNAIRSAHNPASRALLKACDKVGIAVMDELTDVFQSGKNPRDYGRMIEFHWEEDIDYMVAKDYNHPSVIMYSLGNEIPESGTKAGAKTYRKLGRYVRERDRSRYVTVGLNNLIGAMSVMRKLMEEQRIEATNDINQNMANAGRNLDDYWMHPVVVEVNNESFEAMDICGYNYSPNRYMHDAGIYSNWISLGSETFPKDIGYNWKLVTENPSVIGDFTWPALDYLGEAGVGKDTYKHVQKQFMGNQWPWFLAYSADFNLIGVQKPQGYYREIAVGHREAPYVAMQDPAHYEDEPVVASWSWSACVSSWNWSGFEGKPIRVEVYSKADEAELIVNGVSLGRQPLPREKDNKNYKTSEEVAFRTIFETTYVPGKVEAIVYTDGVETGRYAVETVDAAVALDVQVDRSEIKADTTDLAFVEIKLVDAQGRLTVDEKKKVSVTVEGAGELMGLGSGQPDTDENYFDSSCTTFYGQVMAVIRPTEAGEIKVTVSAEGMEPVEVMITAG